MKFTDCLILFVILFVVTLLVYLLIINTIRKKRKKFNEVGELSYLINKFKLKPTTKEIKNMLFVTAFLNAFIISLTCSVVCVIEIGFIWRMMIGFVMLMALIYSVYEIYGRYLKRKEEK